MKSRLKWWWSAVRDSLWFVPAALTTAAAALAFVLLALEQNGLLQSGSPPWWIYQGNAEGARTVLSVITGSLITVTGVVFSVTIVAVQLASTQYTPRILRQFSSDRGNQVVLGIFIGTFTYGFLVLRSVHAAGNGGQEVVPRLAVTVSVALVLVSVAALIYFINHVAREIHVTAILDRITNSTRKNVHQLFPEHIGRADVDPPPDPRQPGGESVTVGAPRSGYLQAVDEDRLFALGERARLVIGMQPKIGEFVLEGRPLASVGVAGGRIDPELEAAIQRAFVLGLERTPHQDVEFGMIQIADIAMKALSPSINDPTTAVHCIDRLAEILTDFGTRKPPESRRTRDGTVRFVASYTTFDEAVKVAYDGIRHFGAPIPFISQHLLDTLAELLKQVPDARSEPLVTQARAVLQSARAKVTNTEDRADIERSAARLSRQLGFDIGGATASGSSPGMGG